MTQPGPGRKWDGQRGVLAAKNISGVIVSNCRLGPFPQLQAEGVCANTPPPPPRREKQRPRKGRALAPPGVLPRLVSRQ